MLESISMELLVISICACLALRILFDYCLMGEAEMFAIVFEKLNAEPAWQKILDKVKVSALGAEIHASLHAPGW